MLRAVRRAIHRRKRLVYKDVDYRDDTLSFDRYRILEDDPRVQHEPTTIGGA